MNQQQTNMGKPQLVISRNRIGTDGEGIRTLVSLSGCPLNCCYCITGKAGYPKRISLDRTLVVWE